MYTDDEQEIAAVRGVFQDITDRKERERDLRIKSRALEESTVGITIADADQDDLPIIYANEGFTRLTGYSTDRVLGDNCRFLQGDGTDDEKVKEIREAIESNTPIQTEILNYRADGTPFWNKLTIAPVTGADTEDVKHYVGIQEDVTVKKRRDRLIGVLNRVLRHNLRNDMNTIIGFADTITERTNDEPAQLAQRISEKGTELSALSEKAQDLQSVMRNAGGIAPRDVLTDVEAVVTELRTEFPEIEFRIKTASSEDVVASEDLRLALRELRANAAQHGDSCNRPHPTSLALTGSLVEGGALMWSSPSVDATGRIVRPAYRTPFGVGEPTIWGRATAARTARDLCQHSTSCQYGGM